MFGLRLTKEDQARLKNGCATQRTTGAASTSSSHGAHGPSHARTGRPTIGAMAMMKSGTVSAAPIHPRRVKSTSSGFGPRSPVGTPIGSSAMPQIGQSPGPSCTISGSIGQV